MRTNTFDLNFRMFLTEMETTQTQKDNIRTIIQKVIVGDKEWLNQQEIIWGDKGPYWILNYGKTGGRNEYNQLVRGMVVAKPQPGFHGDLLSLIRSFPFTRFYNHGEKAAASVDFSNSEMLEKMDGTMVGVFFPHADASSPEFHTRQMMSTHAPDVARKITTFRNKEGMLIAEIKPYVNKLKFNNDDVKFTFVFEFLNETSQVLTQYHPEQYGLYLLGARNLTNHREMTEDELDATAARIGASRPRRFDAVADHSEIEKMFAIIGAETKDFEGYVFRDKTTGHRVKIKDPKYVEKHHLLGGLTYKRLVPLILDGEEDEVIAYFPHARAIVDEIKSAYQNYLNGVVEAVKKWQRSGFVGKELALRIFGPENSAMDKFTKNMSKKLHDVKNPDEIHNTVDQELRKIAIGQGKNAGSPKRLIDMIGLQDDEEENADIGEI